MQTFVEKKRKTDRICIGYSNILNVLWRICSIILLKSAQKQYFSWRAKCTHTQPTSNAQQPCGYRYSTTIEALLFSPGPVMVVSRFLRRLLCEACTLTQGAWQDISPHQEGKFPSSHSLYTIPEEGSRQCFADEYNAHDCSHNKNRKTPHFLTKQNVLHM